MEICKDGGILGVIFSIGENPLPIFSILTPREVCRDTELPTDFILVTIERGVFLALSPDAGGSRGSVSRAEGDRA